MANVVFTETYKNYQIVVEEPKQGNFTYEVNDTILVKTVTCAHGFLAQAAAQSAAESAVDALPDSLALTTIAANVDSHVDANAVLLALRNAGLIFKFGNQPQHDNNDGAFGTSDDHDQWGNE